MARGMGGVQGRRERRRDDRRPLRPRGLPPGGAWRGKRHRRRDGRLLGVRDRGRQAAPHAPLRESCASTRGDRGLERGTPGRRRRIDCAPEMPVNKDAVGKQWQPVAYEVGVEKIREYARAVGEENPVHLDREAALAAGFRDVVAPPMFCVVYSAPAMGPAILDPEVGMNFAAMVHGSQEFEWGEPVCSGDEITTTPRCAEIYEKDGKGFYVFESTSVNQEDAQVVRGTWTNIVRGV